MSNSINIIKEYIKLLVQEYEFEENVLLELWTNKHPMEETKEGEEGEEVKDDATYADLKKKKKTELQELCRAKGHKVTGTKLILIDRILGKEALSSKEKDKPKKSTKKNKKSIANILQKLSHNNNIINIRRNVFNNYEHVETGFVFNEQSQCVVGKQNVNGSVDLLNEKDIETCKEYNFKFEIPETIEIEKPYDDEIMYED